MEPQRQINQSQESQTEIFRQTTNQLSRRLMLLDRYSLRPENELLSKYNNSLCTISDQHVVLAEYCIATPIDPQMAPVYECQAYDDVSNKNPHKYSYILAPPSQGQDSVCSQQQSFEPSFHWLAKRLIDSSLLKVDSIEAKKHQDQVPEEWRGVKELLLTNFKQGFEIAHDNEAVSSFIQHRFDNFPWVKVRKVKPIYYKGKASILIRFADDKNTIFAYFNFKSSSSSLEDYFGKELQVMRCTDNKLRNLPVGWTSVLFRRLSKTVTRESLILMLKKDQMNFTWVEEPVEIGEFRYCLVGVPFIDDAFKICHHFRNNRLCKANLHPNSSKIYRQMAIINP